MLFYGDGQREFIVIELMLLIISKQNLMQKQGSSSDIRQLIHGSSSSQPKNTIQHIHQTKSNLDSLIEQLNVKLHDHFHKKQAELIQSYKQELIHAQKELNQLKSYTNEQQIKNKMIERKKELQKQRYELIQTNMFFSNKCEDYKKKLALLIAEGKQLQKELLFLDSQINNAHQKKYQIISQQTPNPNQQLPNINSAKNNTLPLFSDRKSADKRQNKLANSVSVRDTSKKAILQQSLISKGKKNMVRDVPLAKLTKQLQKTALQELFQVTVQGVRQKRKGKKGVGSIKGEQFTQHQKKQIMQQFLSKQEVKKKIYEIIFQSEEKKGVLPGSFQGQGKIKISFQDIS